ncbi:hypothetical protein D5S17_17650 [Pseudonocardiaceae bacterium YIM PH 21723]|nr:hypothetical protein D5S17_17650 [Pseudonocardiaceae bacterium YIM PH 21723]
MWGTLNPEKLILAVCRNLTSVTRLLETQDLFRGDFRLRWVFTLEGDSHFQDGARRLLAEAGVHPVSKPADVPYDLVLAASENVDFAALRTRALVLPHGIGFNKLLPTADGIGIRVAGLPPEDVLQSGQAIMALAHPDQRRLLPAGSESVVIGDVTMDRLRASRQLREHYRRLLNTGDRRLVLVASTWGQHSALGRWRTLPRELHHALPQDEFQVLCVLHPNVWARYGRRQLEVWFDQVRLLPQHNGWQSAMVAADTVITDHGSLSLYAAGLGLPMLLTETAGETVADSPISRLGAPQIRQGPPLAGQLDRAAVVPVPPGVFAHPGEAADRLRSAVYGLLGLTAPSHPGPLPRALDPVICDAPAASHYTTLTDGVLRRFPATSRTRRPEPLVVSERETDLRLLEEADALVCEAVLAPEEAVEQLRAMRHRWPDRLLLAAATAEGLVIADQEGSIGNVRGTADAQILAAVSVHIGVIDGVRTVEVGGRKLEVQFSRNPSSTARLEPRD